MNKLELGQTVYVKKVGNAARSLRMRNAPIEDYIVRARIKSLGRKYFAVEPINGHMYSNIKFFIDGMNEKTDYTANYHVYLSEEEIYGEESVREISFRIYRKYSYPADYARLPFSKLKAIAEILDIDVEGL